MAKNVVGIFLSDVHWSLNPPVARSVESDWLEVQAGYMEQVRIVAGKHNAPVFIAGDLFNNWNATPHLISQVIQWIRPLKPYCIPGNHDMPNHNKTQLHRSAYWTLVEADAIVNLTVGGSHTVGPLVVYPFPYGSDVTPPRPSGGLCLNVALIHSYFWTKDTGYKGAPENQRYPIWAKKLKGYDAAFFGDNHQSALIQKEGWCSTMNCGSLLRLNMDQRDHKPVLGLLSIDGTITRHYLDTSRDRFMDPAKDLMGIEDELGIDLEEFVEELTNVQTERLDFAKVVLRWMDKHSIPPEVRTVILRAMGVVHNGSKR